MVNIVDIKIIDRNNNEIRSVFNSYGPWLYHTIQWFCFSSVTIFRPTEETPKRGRKMFHIDNRRKGESYTPLHNSLYSSTSEKVSVDMRFPSSK